MSAQRSPLCTFVLSHVITGGPAFSVTCAKVKYVYSVNDMIHASEETALAFWPRKDFCRLSEPPIYIVVPSTDENPPTKITKTTR